MLGGQFILRSVAGENLLIPVGEAANQTKGLIVLSESGVLLFEKIKKDRVDCCFAGRI